MTVPSYVLLLLIFFMVACSNNKAGKKPSAEKSSITNFVPDSSVNKMLRLRNATSTPDSIKHSIHNNVVVLTTASETQYLVAFQDTASAKGAFIGFEITGMSTNLIDYPNIKTKYDEFVTTCGIHLHMPVKEMIKIKGDEYILKSHNGVSIYTYLGAPEAFLALHNGDEYIFECEEVNGTVSRIRFGFVNIPHNEDQTQVFDEQ